MATWIERLKVDPTEWLMDKACPSIRYRLMTEVQGLAADDPQVAELREEVYNYKPPHTISTNQNDDGSWFNSLVGFEALNVNRKKGPGLASQYHALCEYGWGRDHPILWRASELMQGLLWQDPSVDLYDLRGYCGGDPAVEVYLRAMLSDMALAMLSRSGLEDDPGVSRMGEARLARLDAFFEGDVHKKIYVAELTREKENDDGPYDEVCAVIDPAAERPDHWMFLWLAHCPKLRQSERGQAVMKKIVDYMFSQPHPEVEVLEVAGKVFEREMEFSIRNLSREDYIEQKLVGRLLQDLEALARCGVLESVPKAVELLEWLLSLQDEEGVIRAEECIEKVYNRLDYPFFPLEDNWRGKHKKFTDVTFRVLLILSILDAA